MTSYVHGAASRDSGLGSFVYSVELRRRVAEEIRQVSRWRFKKREKGKETKKKKKKKKRKSKAHRMVELVWSGVVLVDIAGWTEPRAYEPKCARSRQ